MGEQEGTLGAAVEQLRASVKDRPSGAELPLQEKVELLEVEVGMLRTQLREVHQQLCSLEDEQQSELGQIRQLLQKHLDSMNEFRRLLLSKETK